MTDIPTYQFGTHGEALHFLHANGYPPPCYQPLLSRLAERYHVTASALRPLWPGQKPEDLQDWKPLSVDLLQFLADQSEGRVIGVGHSIGAVVTLRAAIQQPDRFRAIILIDPVLFPPYFIFGWRIIRALGLGYKMHPLIPSAQRRRREFDDLDKMWAGYRRRTVFRYFSDDALWALVRGLTRPRAGGGYELAYSPDWEVRIYYTGVAPDTDVWRGMKGLKVPMFIIRGSNTDTFFPGTGRRVQRLRPQTEVVSVPESTHLVPLERPQEVFELIHGFSSKL